MKADGSLVSLIQGVSQQPARTRLPGQCTEQVNCSSNVISGLTRRNSFFYARTVNADPDILRWQDFQAPDGNTYFVALGTNKFRLFDFDLREQTVTNDDPAYMDGDELWYESIDDLTYVGNPRRATSMLGDVPVYSRGGGLVHLLGGQYGRIYRITVKFVDAALVAKTVAVTYTTPNGGAAADILNVATEYIATQLETALNANTTFTATFNVARQSDVLYIRYDDPLREDDFSLTVDDGDGGANIFAMTTSVGDTGRLPRYAPHRYVAKITGDGRSSSDDWYLQFLVGDSLTGAALGQDFGKDGVWRECTAPDEPHKWDLTTMPHVLVCDVAPGPGNGFIGQWTLAQGNWQPRQAGADNSNPPPSFLGRTLNDAGTFQGRLTLAAGNSTIMSRTDLHLDFWKQSVVADAPDDPIDVMSTAKSFAVMKRIEPHNRDLVLFSDKAQFIVFGRTAITPNNAALVLTTSFECDLNAAPVSAGRNIFFAINNDAYVGMREFYTEGTEDINDSRPITQHVQKYINGNIKHIASSTNFNMMVVLADGEPNTLYVYEYMWVDSEKVQASWSKWTLPFPIEHCAFNEAELEVILKRTTGKYDLLRMHLERTDDDAIGFSIMADYKYSQFDSGSSITIPFGYEDMADKEFVVVQGAGTNNPGMTAVFTIDETNVIRLDKDYGDGTFWVGIRFNSEYTPTMPMVKDANRVKVGTGKLTVRRFLVQYDLTGYIKAQILSKYRAVREVLFNGRKVGDPDNLVGVQPIASGTFFVPFRGNTDYGEIRLTSNHHTPFTLLDIEWEGQYMKRGKRILGGA